MDGSGARLFGRELDLPRSAVTVRVRAGETLVSDGPFAETKEFLAGFDLLDCADLDEAIDAAAKSPVARAGAPIHPAAAGRAERPTLSPNPQTRPTHPAV